MEYLIPVENVEKLKKKFDRAKKKCNTISFEIKGYSFKEVDGYMAKYAMIEAEGSYKIEGWKFIATVEHTENGNIIRKVTDVSVPERYRTATPICEHCHIRRFRKDTYLIQNVETGEFKQVGKTCLHDYTQGLDPAVCMASAQWIREVEEATDISYSGNSWYIKYFDLKRVALVVLDYIKSHGYNKDMIKENMETMYFGLETKSTDEDFEKICNYLESRPDNDFFYTAKVLFKLPYIETRDFGIVAGAVYSYIKFIEREIASANYNFVGEVGERITLTAESIRTLYSKGCFTYRSDPTLVYRITGTDGNIYIWSTSSEIREGDTITATVKKHSEYNCEKQTVITRGKIVREQKENPAGTFDLDELAI